MHLGGQKKCMHDRKDRGTGGGAENDGHENDGPSKCPGMKLTDMKMQDMFQVSE